MNDFWPFSDVATDEISIYMGPEVFLEDFNAVTATEQVAFVCYWLQAEVLNGGLSQFFSNDTGVVAPEAVEACRKVGLPMLAARVEKAMEWFGQPYPRDRDVRDTRLAEETEDPFDKLDDEIVELIYEENSGLEQASRKYIETHGS